TALPRRARHAQPAAGGRAPALHPHARDAAEQVTEGPGSGSSDLLLGEEVAPPSRAAPLEIPPPLLREARATLDRHRVEQNGKPLELEHIRVHFAFVELHHPRCADVPDRPHLEDVVPGAQAIPGEPALAVRGDPPERSQERDVRTSNWG